MTDYNRALQLAIKSGDKKAELAILRKMKDAGVPSQVDINPAEAGRDAIRGSMPKYQMGLVALGRGFNNLVQGEQQIVVDLGEATGFMSPEENRALQDRIHFERQQAEEPWALAQEKYGGSMTVGEVVGETAPFMNLPALRAAEGAGFAGRLASRGASEAAYGAGEAALPYVEEDESRLENAAEGAAWAVGTSMGVDYLAKRANVRRNRFGDTQTAEGDPLQDMYDIGADEGIPIREGSLEDQTRAVEAAAAGRTTGTSPGQYAEDISGSILDAMNKRKADSDTAYAMLFNTLDSKVGGNITPDGQAFRSMAARLAKEEMAKGGFADKDFLGELQRWTNTPDDKLTFEALHGFRSDLRARMRAMGPKSRNQIVDWQRLENAVSAQIRRQADQLGPGMGDAVKNVDDWYYQNVARLERMPAVKNQLGENPTPSRVADWLMGGKADPAKDEVFQMMTPTGQRAVQESIWNDAYRKAKQGRDFNPLSYAKHLEANAEKLKRYFGEDAAAEFSNIAKVMRHVAAEGKTADNNILRMIRGFPFMYRAVGDAVRRSNFRYKLSRAPADIKPGSTAMENFYRGLIRSAAIQDASAYEAGSDTLGEAYTETGLPTPGEAVDSIGRLLQ